MSTTGQITAVTAPAPAKVKDIPMFFIVGKGRSGTTLLQTLLDANPHVLIPLESRFVIHLKSKYESIEKWNEEKILEYYNDLFTDIKFSTLWQVNRERLKKELLAAGSEADFPLLCKIVYLNYISMFSKQEIRLIGDKNPIYTIFTADLLRIFPGSKFIHLVRDYRDNLHSHMTVFPVKNVPFLARKWKFYNEEAERLKKQHPQSVLTVRYEDLVADPVMQLKMVCEFLNVEFAPAMMEFHKGTNKAYDRLGVYIDKYHSNILNPVNRSKVDVWKSQMKKEHIQTADHIAGHYAKRYGYQKQFAEGTFRLALQSAFSIVKLYTWLFIVRGYYRMPLWIRAVVGNLFRRIFGKEHQKRKQL